MDIKCSWHTQSVQNASHIQNSSTKFYDSSKHKSVTKWNANLWLTVPDHNKVNSKHNQTKNKHVSQYNLHFTWLQPTANNPPEVTWVTCFQNSSELLQHKLTLYIPWTRHPPHSCVPSCPALQAQCSWVCHTVSCPKHKPSLKNDEPSGDTSASLDAEKWDQTYP